MPSLCGASSLDQFYGPSCEPPTTPRPPWPSHFQVRARLAGQGVRAGALPERMLWRGDVPRALVERGVKLLYNCATILRYYAITLLPPRRGASCSKVAPTLYEGTAPWPAPAYSKTCGPPGAQP